MEVKNKSGQKWYDAIWIEFIISIILAKILQYSLLPDIYLPVLLGIIIFIVHLLFGNLFRKAEGFVIPNMSRLDDIFGNKKKKDLMK